MANFSKILGLAGTAFVFAGMAFGQNVTCGSAAASETPLIRVEGTTELLGEYVITCTTPTGGTASGLANLLDIISLPVTSKALTTSSTGITEAVAVVETGATYAAATVPAGTPAAGAYTVQGTVSGSQISFTNVALPAVASGTNIYITVANVRVNATSLTVGTGTPPAITESAFISGTNVNSAVTGSGTVGYAFTGLSTQTAYKSAPVSSASKGSASFLVCQGYKTTGGLVSYIDVGENFATAFKGVGTAAANNTLQSEFNNNTETGFTGIAGSTSNVANTGTMLQVVFSNIPAQVTSLFLPITVAADQTTVGTGTLLLVTSPSSPTAVTASTSSSAPASSGYGAVTIASGGATAYYLFQPGTASSTTTETFAIPSYIVQSANSTTATTGAMSAVVSFAPVGSTQIPNFVIGPSSTTTTLSTFTQCTTSLLYPFITNQLGFDTGLTIANTSTDPFGSNGATPQAGTCTLYFYGAGAPTPNSVTTPVIPSGTVYPTVLSGVAAGFQGYMIAQCNFQFAHGFAFITDGVGANGGLSQGYLAGVIPDTNQLKRTAANPIGVATAGMGETLGN